MLGIARIPWQLYVCYSIVGGLGMSVAYVPCNATVVRAVHYSASLAVRSAHVCQFLGPYLRGKAVKGETICRPRSESNPTYRSGLAKRQRRAGQAVDLQV